MDVHMKSSTRQPFGAKEATGHNPGNDELKFLSQEEQEILYFFEKTIDSLEQSLEEDELRPQIQSFNNSAVDGTSKSRSHRQTKPKEQDIIDLVRPKPDLVQTKDTAFTPNGPDFQSLIPPPESHFEVKPRSDPDPLSLTEYNPSLPESHPVYHPPGSIPTPALIAQKIAETQTGGSTVLSASSLLRQRSSEFDRSSNKQGPPTSTKPARYPANISVVLGNREPQNPSLANINIEERRAQMLANLSGTSHPLLQEDSEQDQTTRNTPTRSVSFRDPTPEKSRMEALSKLGLSRNRTSSGGVSSIPSPPLEVGGGVSATNVERNDPPGASISKVSEPNKLISTLQEPGSASHVLASSKPSEISIAPNVVPPTTIQVQNNPPISKPQSHGRPAAESTNIKLPETSPRSPLMSYRKPDAPSADSHKRFETKYAPQPAYSQNDYFPSPPPPVETSAEFNSYGGKSIVVNSSASLKNELPPSPVSPEPRTPPALATPIEFNSYGGKSKVMNPIPVSRRDLPDILSSHIDKSQSQHSENAPIEANSYGGKTRIINASVGANRPSEGSSRTVKPPAPAPAPRAPRHSYHGQTTAPKSPQRALSPDHKRRTSSMFRPQGITVQFSGKGASEESRKEALRKLGLLKE